MTKKELFEELEQAYLEMIDLIEESSERGQFNSSYFKPRFLKWYVQLDDKKAI